MKDFKCTNFILLDIFPHSKFLKNNFDCNRGYVLAKLYGVQPKISEVAWINWGEEPKDDRNGGGVEFLVPQHHVWEVTELPVGWNRGQVLVFSYLWIGRQWVVIPGRRYLNSLFTDLFQMTVPFWWPPFMGNSEMLNNILLFIGKVVTKSIEETNHIYLFQMQTDENNLLYVNIRTVPTNTQFKPYLIKACLLLRHLMMNS